MYSYGTSVEVNTPSVYAFMCAHLYNIYWAKGCIFTQTRVGTNHPPNYWFTRNVPEYGIVPVSVHSKFLFACLTLHWNWHAFLLLEHLWLRFCRKWSTSSDSPEQIRWKWNMPADQCGKLLIRMHRNLQLVQWENKSPTWTYGCSYLQRTIDCMCCNCFYPRTSYST